MGRHSRRNNRAEETVDPVVRALKFVAQNSDFDRAWRPADDYGRIIDQVFDVPRGMKDELTAVLINSHLSKDPCYSPFVDFDKAGSNATGIFRKEYQYKTPDGKNCKSKYLYLCSENELPVKPEGKWYCDIKALHAGWDKGPRGMGENENENYKKIRIDLLILLRELRKKQERPKKKAMDKRERDKEPTDEPSAKAIEDPCAKKQKRGDLSASLKDLDNEAIVDTRLLKLIACISEGDEHTKFQMTKDEIVSLMNFATAQCMAKLARLAVAEQEQAAAAEQEVISVDDEPNEHDNQPNEPNEPTEPNDPIETIDLMYRYKNSSVSIATQDIELPNSHAVVSRSYLSRLVESDKLSRKLKAKITKAKQYRSSPLGQRLYNAALIQAPRMSLYAAEQVLPLVVAAFLADAGIAFDPEALSKSCPSAKTLNSFIVDGSIDSILWLEDQFRDADAVFISCDKGSRKGIDHFPKVISWWSKTEQKVMSACIDADGSGGKSEECAAAIWLCRIGLPIDSYL
jgi:hypothetical protein